ncbi:MAG: type II toxin-antitoxin system RelE/ParE family toxin [Nitrospinae bacterium]|nr:type II toxin-antitoxin system RelE/ParE family toxin [Nitrospinota bacterium]
MTDFPVDVRFFRLAGLSEPVVDWLGGLKDREGKAAIHKAIAKMRLGNFGDSKPVGKGVLERRIDTGPGYRVYYGRHGGNVVILLCGGDKKSQKRDINTAIRYWEMFKSLGTDK